MLKRTFDIVMSVIALVLLGIPMLIIAMLIRIGSPGPALFRQRRAGWKQKPFTMLKFRTMRSDVDPYGGSPHSGEDPRLTRMGRFLRERSLDELPQFLNVLTGTMSMIGPRPLYERQAQQWDERQKRRLQVRPGITGYAQVYGRAQMTIEQKIEMDLHYVDNRSFGMDLKILFRTAANVLTSQGDVYERRYSKDSEYESDSDEVSGPPESGSDEDRNG